jgi:PAS domain S-box-containing protein
MLSTIGLRNLWATLTAPRAADLDEARREYMTMVICLITSLLSFCLALIFGTGWGIGFFPLDSLLITTAMTVLFGGGWWLAHRGHWRVAGYIPSAVIFLTAVYGNWIGGAGAPAMVLYALSIALTAILQGEHAQWVTVVVSVGAFVWIGWAQIQGQIIQLRFPETAFPNRVVIVVGTYSTIAALLWFLVSQFKLALAQSRAYARELAQRSAELTAANRQLEQDIAERGRAEEALRESEEKFRNIVEQASDAILLCDEQGVVVAWNRASEQVTGLRAADVLGKFIWDVQFEVVPKERRTPDLYERFHSMIQQALDNGHSQWFSRPINGELECPDGTRRYFQQTVFPIQTAKGVMVGSITRDLTEQVQAEKEREKLFGELEEALTRVKTLSGLLPICANCKKIRDDRGEWRELEVYVRDHSEADFSHGICPECAEKLYPGFFK